MARKNILNTKVLLKLSFILKSRKFESCEDDSNKFPYLFYTLLIVIIMFIIGAINAKEKKNK